MTPERRTRPQSEERDGAEGPEARALRSIPLFARLGAQEIVQLGQLAEEIDVVAGKVLMRQGEHGAEASSSSPAGSSSSVTDE